MSRVAFALHLALLASSGASAPRASAQQTGARFELHPDLRIDGYSANLVPIRWLGVAPNGTIALVQRQDQTVRFFDDTGKALGTFGREGAGPGEFRFMDMGGWLGDTLWIADVGLRRIAFISPAHTLVRTLPFRAARPRPADAGRFPTYPPLAVKPHGVFPDNSLLMHAIGPDFNSLLRVSPDGYILEQIIRSDYEQKGVAVRINSGRGSMSAPVPFAAPTVLVASPDGQRVGTVVPGADEDDPTYRVTLATSNGDTVFSRDYSYKPQPVTPQAIDSVITRMSAEPLLKRAGTGPLRELIAKLRRQIPATMPHAIGMFIASDGRVWIELHPTPTERPWLILDGRGDLVGDVTAPANVFLRAADRFRVWGVERDDVGVETVVRYRLERSR